VTTPTQVYFQGRPLAQEYLPNEQAHRRQLAHVINRTTNGQTNNTFQVTLTPSTTTTVIFDERISVQTAIFFSALTAHAATALASGSLYVIPAAGTATIHHASNAATDQSFMVSIIG
jgi:hypothetical protein